MSFNIALQHILPFYLEGDFTLSSGKKSPFYLDIKGAMLTPDVAYGVGMLTLIHAKEIKATAIAGLELGACPIVSAACARAGDSLSVLSLEGPRKFAYIRKADKLHGKKSRIEGAPLKGERVLIVEDVTTTGASACNAIHVAKEAGAEVIGVLTVVDRCESGEVIKHIAGVPVTAIYTINDIREAKRINAAPV